MINNLLRKLKLKKPKRPSFDLALEIKKKELGKKIHKIFLGKVYNGPYESTKVYTEENWSTDMASKILGIYEEQVQFQILKLQKKYKLKSIVNFGSADGYHIVSLIKNSFFKDGMAFEIDPFIKKSLVKNININNLSKKIKIFGNANFNETNRILSLKNLKKTLFLVDIEGEEFNLFIKKNLSSFKNSFLIIENHDFMVKDKKKVKNFYKLIKNNFNVEILKNGSRNPFKSVKLSMINDTERWLLASEGRPCEMNWIVCVPKL